MGDYIFVEDLVADGNPVSVNWRIPSAGRSGQCITSLGKGASAFCNKNFPEHTTIVFTDNSASLKLQTTT
ncbi:hypothetical protein [Amycolatopsis ultiminotia]